MSEEVRAFIPDHVRGDPPYVILGQAGSGKTRELVSWVKKDFSPFAFFSYTRAGVRAGKDQMGLEVAEGDHAYVGTLHSLCARYGNLGGKVFRGSFEKDDLKEFEKKQPGVITTMGQYFHNRNLPGESRISRGDDKADYDYRINTFQDTSAHGQYEKLLTDNHMVGFSEALVETFRNGWLMHGGGFSHFNVSRVFADECQDFTPLMWAIVFERFDINSKCFFAGDPRQRLYEMGGVNPLIFDELIRVSLAADRVIHQPICYRIPQRIYSFCKSLAVGYRDSDFWSKASEAPRSVKSGGFLVLLRSDTDYDTFLNALTYEIASSYPEGISVHRIAERIEYNKIFMAMLSATNVQCRIGFMALAMRGICPAIPHKSGQAHWLWDPHKVSRYIHCYKKAVDDLDDADKKAVSYIDKHLKAKGAGKALKAFLKYLICEDPPYETRVSRFERAYNRSAIIMVSTVHQVKGLEFPWVLLRWERGRAGENEDYLPVFYVGSTRSMDGLVIHSNKTMDDPELPGTDWLRRFVCTGEDAERYEKSVYVGFRALCDSLMKWRGAKPPNLRGLR